MHTSFSHGASLSTKRPRQDRTDSGVSAAVWQPELSEREKDGTLTYPSIRAALVQAGPNAPPAPAAWEEFLDAPSAHDLASIRSLMDNLSVVANYEAATLSSALTLLAHSYNLPARIITYLCHLHDRRTRPLGQICLGGVPPWSRPRMASELEQFVQTVTNKYGGADLEVKQQATLTTLARASRWPPSAASVIGRRLPSW